MNTKPQPRTFFPKLQGLPADAPFTRPFPLDLPPAREQHHRGPALSRDGPDTPFSSGVASNTRAPNRIAPVSHRLPRHIIIVGIKTEVLQVLRQKCKHHQAWKGEGVRSGVKLQKGFHVWKPVGVLEWTFCGEEKVYPKMEVAALDALGPGPRSLTARLPIGEFSGPAGSAREFGSGVNPFLQTVMVSLNICRDRP